MTTNFLILPPDDLLIGGVGAFHPTNWEDLVMGSLETRVDWDIASNAINIENGYANNPSYIAIYGLQNFFDTSGLSVFELMVYQTASVYETFNIQESDLVEGWLYKDLTVDAGVAYLVTFSGASAFDLNLSKILSGVPMDFGREPLFSKSNKINLDGRKVREVVCSYTGISNAKKLEFSRRIGKYKDCITVLLKDTNQYYLDTYYMYAKIKKIQYKLLNNIYWNIDITFEEVK